MWEFWRSAHKEDNVQPPHGSPFAHPGPHAAVVEARSAGQSNSSTPMHRPATPSVQSDPGSPGFSHGAIPQFNSVGLPAVPERAPSVLTTPTGGSHVSKALSRLLTTSVNFRDVHFVTEASDAKQVRVGGFAWGATLASCIMQPCATAAPNACLRDAWDTWQLVG